MFDCSKDILAFHDKEVTLPQAERNMMRERRDANRARLVKGLATKQKSSPREFASQGSYAMKTMVQYPNKDYDIDDGVYFDKEALVGERGGEISALHARQMVRDALDDGSFKTPPEALKNCVRVHYQAGFHVDVPVYRCVTAKDFWRNETYYELASSDWKRSDARDVTRWFENENANQSPDTVNGRQLRRIVRQIKKFANSRESWRSQVLGGFGITKLVVECFLKDETREDRALYNTMKQIRDRLKLYLVIIHPVMSGETITKGNDDANVRFLRDRLTEAINMLDPLFITGCTRSEALKCWDKVFATTFFTDREELTLKANTSLLRNASIASPVGAFSFTNVPRIDDKPRSFG